MTGECGSGSAPSRLGPYELIRPLAQGGMAEIFLARRAGGAPVAVKVLRPDRARDAEASAMFLDEARLVAMLSHHNIAAVLDIDVERHYLAMELIDGADLRQVLVTAQRLGQAIPYETAVTIVSAAAAGLDHAHRRCGPDGNPLRLVHRDVSLSNIMVGHDGSVKIVDFGIASTTIASVHTLPGVVRGKASYMSPEQCLGEALDHRADVFGLGVVLYELTTGARCFHGKTDFERMLAVVKCDYAPPSALVPGYPQALAQVIATALAPSPSRRFASCAAMIDALAQAAIGEGWVGGAGAIQRLMRGLFGGEPAARAASPADDVPVTEPHTVVPSWGRRLARGTASDCAPVGNCPARDSEPDDDLDHRTRGRAPLRRPVAM